MTVEEPTSLIEVNSFVANLPVTDVRSLFNQATIQYQSSNLGHGFMNFPVPEFIKEAAAGIIQADEFNQYAPPRGVPRLRRALAKDYSPKIGRELDPEKEIIITAGANEGLLSIMHSFCKPGDEVIMFEPYFDAYVSHIKMLNATPVYCPLRINPSTDCSKPYSSSDYYIDISELRSKVSPRTKMMILNSPHNPFGKIFSREELREIGQVAIENNILIVSDEVYDRVVFSPNQLVRVNSIPELWDRTITVYSGGKSFGITGWRIGWVVGPQKLMRYVTGAHAEMVYCANAPLQEAVGLAFEQAESNGFFTKQLAKYTRLCHKLMDAFDRVGLPYVIPQGGIFLLVDTSKVRIPAHLEFPEEIASRGETYKMCYFITRDIGVTAIPATEFYSSKHAYLAQNILRFAFCKTDDIIDEAAERLQKLTQYIMD
ncbi:aminotransferase [Basidiobolus meristosporus CBS 931.73]|uniref:Aminotransferase n=1 Tax=Basidiobolus meristosporus CBS 931.73 TaxID=1314790 RepID=A0A1Y1Y116_9FUNG|nr:aminotransferase [Basidiobolus meristosporus CBS 931.73]|eukprot:ORX91697.1 aminotransferase [Basidiobolus meristosporus CBS 931.73]